MLNGLVMLDVDTGYLDCELTASRDAAVTEKNLNSYAVCVNIKWSDSGNGDSFLVAANT